MNAAKPLFPFFLKLLLSICSLLTDPNPREVYNRKARTLFLKNRKKYEETVVEWTRNYAID
jgi:ubiquitin-conjugating enzyme E2 D